MKSKKIVVASLLILSLILIAGLEANEGTFLEQSVRATETGSASPSFSPSFNGVWYSSTGSPRSVAEYLFGNKPATKQSILGKGTSTLAIDIPSGWNPTDLSARISNLYANRSYTRNSNFSSGSAGYPYSWTNKTTGTVKTGWENTTSAHDIYIYILASQPVSVDSFGRWNQTFYINAANSVQARLTFRIKRAGGITNYANIRAYAFINQTQVFIMNYSNIPSSFTLQYVTIDIPKVPTVVNLTLKMGFTGGGIPNPNGNGYIYFDDVDLYVNGTVVPKSVDLKLNDASVSGQQYGQGTVHLQGAPSTPPFVFRSNLTSGSVNFTCNSAVKITKVDPTGLVNYNVTKGSVVYYNVTKPSNFTSVSGRTFNSTVYNADVLNMSLPRDWVYERLIRPDGAVEANSSGQVKIWNNNSYNWVIMVNVTAIGSYGPNPYIVVAQAPNYLGSISTYRSKGTDWVPGNFFANGSRIKINSTVLVGGASSGSAYVVFYNVSDYSVRSNMSNYAATPASNRSVSFNFKWSNSVSGADANVSKSDLIALVLWSNESEVGGNWTQINFDLDAPNMGITTAGGNQYLRGVTDLTLSYSDAHPNNMSLYINGTNVGNWTSPSASTIVSLNTTKYGDGHVQLKAQGWDQVDHVNTTVTTVYIDNTPPLITSNLPSNGSYVHEEIPLTIMCTDTNLRGVTLFINSVNRTSINSGSLYFDWITAPYTGTTNLTVMGSDKAGNLIRITSQVIVDNIPPVVGITLSTVGQYVSGNRTLNIVCSDSHFKNVTLLIDGAAKETWLTSSPSYNWNTDAYGDGIHTLGLIGRDLAGNVNQTTLLTVYVDNTPPSTPQLTYPNNGESFNSTTLGHPISWYAASDSGSGVDHYILQLDTSPSFNSVNLRTIDHLTFTTYSIPSDSPLSNGTWYWRVSAVDDVGNAGVFSQPRSFQVIVKLAPPVEGLPVPILVGLLGGIPALVVLSSVVLLRKRKRDAESAEYDVKNLMAAYIFSSDGRAMFSHPFTETRVDPQLLSGILTAISEVMKEVVGGDRRPLSTIERSDAKVIVEFGSAVMGALVAKKASREYRRRLRAFLARFEDVYGDKLAKWDGNESIFQAAPEIIEEIFCASAKVTTYPSITGLEDLLASGKLGGVAVSVAGKTGSGKTEFCLRYAASLLKRGNAVIAFAASIPPKEIREQLKSNGVDVEKVQEKGVLIIYDAYSGVSGLKSEEKYKFGSPGELNNINLALSRNLGKLKNATILFDSLSTMIDYSDLELAVDFVRTVKVKLQQGGHVAFFIIDSNAHDEKTLNYILHVMDGEIETITETKKKGELERLVSFKRLKGFQVKPGYHELR